jgi:hypothetical protein
MKEMRDRGSYNVMTASAFLWDFVFCTTRRASVILDTPNRTAMSGNGLGGVLGIIAFQQLWRLPAPIQFSNRHVSIPRRSPGHGLHSCRLVHMSRRFALNMLFAIR